MFHNPGSVIWHICLTESTEAMGEVEKTVKWHSSPILCLAFLQPNMYVQASEQMCVFIYKCGGLCCTKSISSETPSQRMLRALCFSTWTSTSHQPYKYCCTINMTTHHINISISPFAMIQKNHGKNFLNTLKYKV